MNFALAIPVWPDVEKLSLLNDGRAANGFNAGARKDGTKVQCYSQNPIYMYRHFQPYFVNQLSISKHQLHNITTFKQTD